LQFLRLIEYLRLMCQLSLGAIVTVTTFIYLVLMKLRAQKAEAHGSLLLRPKLKEQVGEVILG